MKGRKNYVWNSMFIAVLIAATIAYFSLDAFNVYSTKQEKDNIKEAIMDN